MPKSDGRERREPLLRWFCGVPVLANPLILIDLLSAVVIMWFVTVLLVVGAQALLGEGPLLKAHITAACIWACYVSALMPLMYFAVCLVFFRRGYVTLYRLEENGLFMETMRGKNRSGGVFAIRPFSVEGPFDDSRHVVRDISWTDVKAVTELSGMSTLLLKGRFGTLARVYCPDRQTYTEALAFIRKKAVSA